MQFRDLRGKTVLVTGGAGFIGSHLVDRLLAEEAARVVVVDNLFLGNARNLEAACATAGDRLAIYREDAGDAPAVAAIMARENIEVVYNMATKALLYSFLNPTGAYMVNVRITECLLDLLRGGAYSTLIHCSSSEVFGTALQVPMTEDHPINPETTYAAGKAGADLMVRTMVGMFDLDACILRPFNNYGPRQNDKDFAAIVPLTLRRIRAGARPIIEGDGLQTRDFIFVGDTVDALIEAYRRPGLRGESINVGAGFETPIIELVQAICRATGYDGPIEHRPARPADVRRHCAGTDRARRLLDFSPRVCLDDGIRRTVDWYDRTESYG